MASRCEICGKHPHSGNFVSHANKKALRLWRPNVQRLKVQTSQGNRRIWVCTGCIRAGKVKKAYLRPALPAPAKA